MMLMIFLLFMSIFSYIFFLNELSPTEIKKLFHSLTNLSRSDIFPKILKVYPELKLNIIGKYMPNKLKNKIASFENINYLGFVENINEEISGSLLMIAPIKIGSGLKMKIPHVLSCGVPVITTSVGAEGIDMNKETGLYIENDMNKMIGLSVKLLESKTSLINLGAKAQKSVNLLFNTDEITNKFNSIYKLS